MISSMNENQGLYFTDCGYQVCQGPCALTLPASSAFFPGLGDTCRLCQRTVLGDKPTAHVSSADPEPEPAAAAG